MQTTSSSGTSDTIETLKFVRRKESWVTESSGCFYKIIRKSNDPLQDLFDPACIAMARREYSDMRSLHELADGVCCPERVEHACIVYPQLSGPDMRELLMDKSARAQHETCLRDAIMLLGCLHRSGERAGYPMKDYRRDSFLPPGEGLLERMEACKRTLVVTGFEARNFRFDRTRAAWFFFDPHHLWFGYPEEDFARFVISLLMIQGRRKGFRPWTNFDRFRLLSIYENHAAAQLDRKLLNYFLHEQLAKRRFHATRTTGRLPPARAIFRVYTKLYYRQLRRALAFQQF